MAGMLCGGVVCSCSKTNPDSGAPGSPSGSLVGDDETANAELAGVRLAAVGEWRYAYDEKGALAEIRVDDVVLKAKDNFKLVEDFQDDDESGHGEFTPTIQSNHVTSFSTKSEWRDGNSSGKMTMSADFKYNEKGQLASWSGSNTETETYIGGQYAFSESINATLKYDAKDRLTSVDLRVTSVEDGEKEDWQALFTFDYSHGWPNKFYQYTPIVFDVVSASVAGVLEGFAYVGLFGKASSEIPSSILLKKIEDGETSEEKVDGLSCELNGNGTIRRADWNEYAYTDVKTRAESAVPAFGKADVKRLLGGGKFGSRHGGRR